nr:protein nrt1/ ptr family 1.2 [Quercus suber]
MILQLYDEVLLKLIIAANEALEKVASWGAGSKYDNVLDARVPSGISRRDQHPLLLGMLLLCLTAIIPEARPPPCNPFTTHSCRSPTTAQMTLLISSFAIMSIGAGGTRPCSLVLGADQLEKRDNPQSQSVLRSFFGWYYASAALSILIAYTGIVYIQDHLGWKVGFGVPTILMFLSAFFFFLASPLYVMKKPSKSIFTSFLQVLVAAYRKRKFPLPHTDLSYKWYYQKGSKLVLPTNKLWFLNRACIIRNTGKEIAPNASAASDPWNFCTIEQVEELKALIKVLPLWSTGIMVSISTTQSSFPLRQAKSMNRHITSSFKIPPASFGLFSIVALIVWVALYYRLIIPLASKIKGKPMWLGAKQRMGIGVFLSCLAMVVSANVEKIRRGRAIQEGFMNNANEDSEMSALWLVPQYCLIGLAEAFNAIGQIEFYYAELPKVKKKEVSGASTDHGSGRSSVSGRGKLLEQSQGVTVSTADSIDGDNISSLMRNKMNGNRKEDSGLKAKVNEEIMEESSKLNESVSDLEITVELIKNNVTISDVEANNKEVYLAKEFGAAKLLGSETEFMDVKELLSWLVAEGKSLELFAYTALLSTVRICRSQVFRQLPMAVEGRGGVVR